MLLINSQCITKNVFFRSRLEIIMLPGLQNITKTLRISPDTLLNTHKVKFRLKFNLFSLPK